jgi:TonB family protein
MVRSDRFIFLAVCASLLLHAGALELAKDEAKYPRVSLPPIRRAMSTVVIALQPPKTPLPPRDDDQMGDRKGTGTASSSSDGAQPLQARKADQDQPALSREPTGPGKIGHAPIAANDPIGERGRGGQRGQTAANSTPEPLAPSKMTPPQPPAMPSPAALTPPPSPQEQPKLDTPQPPALTLTAQIAPSPETKAKTLLIPPEAQTPMPPTTRPAVQVAIAAPTPPPSPSPQKAAPKVASQVATGDGLAPGHANEADPFQQSDSESDAFTTTGSAVFRDGRISVRSGRKIKTVRPHLLVSGLMDTIGVNDPTLQLKINVAATGEVTHVEVVHSSGSSDIDQPCQIAVKDWWFEPRVDKNGKPIPDVVLFTISFR